VRVHLSSIVRRVDVNLGLVEKSHHLNVVGSLHELDTLQCAFGDKARPVTGLSAPRNHLAFLVGNKFIGVGGAPKAEVCCKNRHLSEKEVEGDERHQPSRELRNEVWQSEFWFWVVELQILNPNC
jgi:hypothetical protein